MSGPTGSGVKRELEQAPEADGSEKPTGVKKAIPHSRPPPPASTVPKTGLVLMAKAGWQDPMAVKASSPSASSHHDEGAAHDDDSEHGQFDDGYAYVPLRPKAQPKPVNVEQAPAPKSVKVEQAPVPKSVKVEQAPVKASSYSASAVYDDSDHYDDHGYLAEGEEEEVADADDNEDDCSSDEWAVEPIANPDDDIPLDGRASEHEYTIGVKKEQLETPKEELGDEQLVTPPWAGGMAVDIVKAEDYDSEGESDPEAGDYRGPGAYVNDVQPGDGEGAEEALLRTIREAEEDDLLDPEEEAQEEEETLEQHLADLGLPVNAADGLVTASELESTPGNPGIWISPTGGKFSSKGAFLQWQADVHAESTIVVFCIQQPLGVSANNPVVEANILTRLLDRTSITNWQVHEDAIYVRCVTAKGAHRVAKRNDDCRIFTGDDQPIREMVMRCYLMADEDLPAEIVEGMVCPDELPSWGSRTPSGNAVYLAQKGKKGKDKGKGKGKGKGKKGKGKGKDIMQKGMSKKGTGRYPFSPLLTALTEGRGSSSGSASSSSWQGNKGWKKGGDGK